MWLEGDQVPSGCCSMCRSSLERCRASRLAWPTKPSSDLVVSWGQFERPTPVHTKHLDFGFSSMIWDMFLYFSFSFWIFVISWVQGSIQLFFFFNRQIRPLKLHPGHPAGIYLWLGVPWSVPWACCSWCAQPGAAKPGCHACAVPGRRFG